MSRTKQSARRKKRAAEAAGQDSNKKQKKATDAKKPSNDASKPVKGSRQWAEASLIKLLGGMSLDTFLSEYFEKKPLLPHSMGFGKDLTVCRYVNSERENFDGEDSDGHAKSRQVASLLDKGYSCQFYQPQRYVDGLYELNAAFEEVFGGLAGASAYLTPANSQALAPHHDEVEVFVLQTEGRKKWKLYHPLMELAGEHSSDLEKDQIGEPWMEITVEEGDLLYFPRGVVHEAYTDKDKFSTHVTISVYQHNTWANFLEVALPRVIRHAFDSDVEFRRGLPVGYLGYMGTQFPADSNKAKEFAATCKKLVGQLAEHIGEKNLQESADEAAMDLLANRLPPPTDPKKKKDETGASPLESNVTISFKNRSHIRLSMGEDEEKEAFVAVYYSLTNCRRHHMGICMCEGEDDDADEKEDDDADEKEDDEDEEGSETGERAETSSADGDKEEDDDESGDEDEDLSAAFGQMPPQAKNIVFPGELAQTLLKLYASSASGPGVSIEELTKDVSDETAVRGMLLRLWSEGLLDVTEA
ncbi:hypothetical protein JM16_002137 [Phytophthora kernoviae]|uniref:Bifunctional lysine-specific demethylase and histidyl-hydroxylase n=1 Tax=Phytophthora kernoviae TaxID=325452 RepID=A0A8T0M4Y3_9STRA|nr:hypothetical protein JM16_002137 [Phytophthora kernoviae]